MIFLGYWSLWFMFGFMLQMLGKIKFTLNGNNFSFITLLFYSFIMAVPSVIMHYAFKLG